jgi:site-specific recombinase XerD
MSRRQFTERLMGITTIDSEAAKRNSGATGTSRHPAQGTRAVAEIVQCFLDYYWIRHPVSEDTLAHYQRDLLAAAQWLETARKKTLLNANLQDLREYLGVRNGEPGNLPSLSCIKRFYFYMVEVGLRTDDPTERLFIRTPRLVRHNLEMIPRKRN